ncbi:Glucose dehydrogenase [FAD, quinone] [Blattella germanica]|nr:Glucose dehydrogenase [FAD, quinone] [Blattella germanica]
MECPTLTILCYFLNTVMNLINYQTPADLNSFKTLQWEEADFIIVGAGPAGALLANREPKYASVPAYTSYTQQARLTVTWPVENDSRFCGGKMCPFDGGLGLGGGTLHNEMIYNRGHKDIFNTWKKLGNDGWSYEEILPFFKKWENNLDPEFYHETRYHARGGSQSVGRWPYTDISVSPLLHAFEEVGLKQRDVNGKEQEGVMHLQFFQKDGQRQSANKAFLEPIENIRDNLKILTNVKVTRVIIDPKTKRATGVEYASEKTRAILGKLKAKKEVIVSGGAISSPQILMLSGIGPEETLKPLGIPVIKNLNVGVDLQNHNRIDVNLLFKNGRGTMPATDQAVLSDFLKYESNHTGPLAAIGAFAINAYIHSNQSKPTEMPDLQILFGPRHLYEYEQPPSFQIPHSYYDSIRAVVYAVLPKSRGYVSINSSDPFHPPLINAFNNTEEDDYLSMVDGALFLTQKVFKTEAFKTLGAYVDEKPAPLCSRYTFNTKDYWLCYAKHYTEPSRHYASSCRMGPSSDPISVVDSQLKVHGVPNLRVIDASIMPLLVNGNTNAPVLMIAEKGADMIIKQYRRKHD